MGHQYELFLLSFILQSPGCRLQPPPAFQLSYSLQQHFMIWPTEREGIVWVSNQINVFKRGLRNLFFIFTIPIYSLQIFHIHIDNGDIRCFECNSMEDARCHDPFNYSVYTHEMPPTQTCKGCCVKMVQFIGTGNGYIMLSLFVVSFSIWYLLVDNIYTSFLHRALSNQKNMHGHFWSQFFHG